jgi:glycosyltransferase involved in cell wall biosynthesis
MYRADLETPGTASPELGDAGVSLEDEINPPARNVGLAHDYLLVMRGAERTFAAMADTWPSADIYTSLYCREGTRGSFDGRRIRVSGLQRLGLRQRGFRCLLPLFPRAFESLHVEDCDLVVSSSSAFAHGLRPRHDATHVCYCHTPFRYAWHERSTALAEAPFGTRTLLSHQLDRIQRWDRIASERVTHYIANSRQTQERIEQFYGRESVVIHPPVDVNKFAPGEPLDYFLLVTELVAHKRVDVALEAARIAGAPIKVVGTGPETARLRARFPEVDFLGRVSDHELAGLYAGARAFLVPGVEEFGIAAVEAQAAGRPVVAVGAGGVLETVVDGETGVLLPGGGVDEFAEAIREIDFDRFRGEAIARHADRFSTSRFQRQLRTEVRRILRRRRGGTHPPQSGQRARRFQPPRRETSFHHIDG